MNNCCCAELVVDEGQQIELSVETDGGIEVGVAEQFVIGGGGNYQSKTVNITPTESAQSQTVQADVGYDALDEVEVNVAAIADDYVGSAVPRRASSSLSASGATVTAPAGYYANQASKSVQSGTEGTPTATKGAVSNHAVSVTPSVTNTTGYISGGTKTGTAVSVSASELVSGTKSITANGTGIDVTNYEKVDVAVPGQTPTGTKNISITANGTTTEDVAAYANAQITANVPNSYTAGDEGKVVSNGALVSQTSDTVTQNGTVDTTLINSLLVNVSGGGGSSNLETGTLTLASDVSVPSSGSSKQLTGIDFSFKPDVFLLMMTPETYVSQVATENTKFKVILAIKKNLIPPWRITNNISTDSVTNDYVWFYAANTLASSDITIGYAINGWSPLGQSYYPYWYINDDGEFYFSRISSSGSVKFPAATYKYIGLKL